MKKRRPLFSLTSCPLFLVFGFMVILATEVYASSLDGPLRKALSANLVEAIEKPETAPAKVTLGRLLFWDKILSGNKNISCATCHLPQAATSDALSLSIGQGGTGMMSSRIPPKDNQDQPIFVPRNSLDIFNRAEFVTFFWDGRVMTRKGGHFFAPVGGSDARQKLKMWTPAAFSLPANLDSGLAAQAMFPPTSDTEMRGRYQENHLGNFERWDWLKIWPGLISRILEFKEYRDLFQKAYPNTPQQELTFAHAANAIAAFEIDAFTLTDSPFDQYLRGNATALSDLEKKGALLFYGKAKCAQCHSGKLMTDQIFHNRAVPQIGPGKGENLPAGGSDGTWDAGRGGVTGFTEYYYSFRTPPLRNVEKTGPWMHDGAFTSLEATVIHELDPIKSAQNYDPQSQLPTQYALTYRQAQMDTIASLALTKPGAVERISLNSNEFQQLIAFLKTLTSPSLGELISITPKKVPSGLPVED